jgi:hypothetical protein
MSGFEQHSQRGRFMSGFFNSNNGATSNGLGGVITGAFNTGTQLSGFFNIETYLKLPVRSRDRPDRWGVS